MIAPAVGYHIQYQSLDPGVSSQARGAALLMLLGYPHMEVKATFAAGLRVLRESHGIHFDSRPRRLARRYGGMASMHRGPLPPRVRTSEAARLLGVTGRHALNVLRARGYREQMVCSGGGRWAEWERP